MTFQMDRKPMPLQMGISTRGHSAMANVSDLID